MIGRRGIGAALIVIGVAARAVYAILAIALAFEISPARLLAWRAWYRARIRWAAH